MEGLIMTAQLIAALAILVILHEMGHYLTARAFGIRVEKFYLFFDAWGIKLFSFKKGETEYGIGWLPLGGYVKIAGMIDESMDTEAMEKPPEPWEFRSKPAWQRLIVMLGGVTVNVILGIVIFSFIIYGHGESYLPNDQLKDGIVAYELGQEIGLKTGDKIIALNGEKVERFDELLGPKILLGNDVILNVERNGKMLDIPIPADLIEKIEEIKNNKFIGYPYIFHVQEVLPGSNAEKAGLLANDKIILVNEKYVNFLKSELSENKNHEIILTIKREELEILLPVQVDENGELGFSYIPTDDYKWEHIEYGLFQSFAIGNQNAWNLLFANVMGFGMIIRGEISASKALAGPIGIATMFGGEWIWKRFWLLTGALSMILAFVNILPIPALDGGHAVFLSIEAVSGKKFSDKFMIKVQVVGMVILFALMAFIIGNDIWKLF